MSNEITAYFKGTSGVSESVYQYDYGMILIIDGPDLTAPFEVHFEHTGGVDAVTAIGQDNRVAIPNACLALPGRVTAYIYDHTGQHDGQTAYVVRFQVMNRARPVDEVTDEQDSAISKAIALLAEPIDNIETIVNEALAKTGTTLDRLEQEFNTAVSAVTTDTEVTDIRVGDDGVTYNTAGQAVREQFSNLKDDLTEIKGTGDNIGFVTNYNNYYYVGGVYAAKRNEYQVNLWGTASGWAKFDILRGNSNVTSGTPTLSNNLEAGTYTLRKTGELDVLVGTDYSESVEWFDNETKSFESDVCVWLRVTSSSRNYGTDENPSIFSFAIYEGDVDMPLLPCFVTAIDRSARSNIEVIDSKISDAKLDDAVHAGFDILAPHNIIPPDITWFENNFIDFTTGAMRSYTGNVASDYIEIDPSYGYLCNYVNVRIVGDPNFNDGTIGVFERTNIAFYDKDKNFVPTSSESASASKAIPSKAKYVRVTLYNANRIPYAICFYGNYNSLQTVRYTPYRKEPKQTQFYGYTGFENLKMVMFGDSITHGDLGISDDGISYVDYANDFLRGNIINVGLGGSRLSQGDPTGVGLGSFASLCENIVSDSATAWDALDAYATASNPTWIPHINKLKAVDWSKTQAIGLLYGANDWNNSVSIGTETNNDPEKYDGACVYGLDLLLTKYPHLQVILFTPFYRKIDATKDADTPNTKGYTIYDYGKSLQENVRPAFHCPVVDSGNEIGINRYNIYVYTQLVDGTHPRTNIAQYRLGRYFAESIKRYIQPF